MEALTETQATMLLCDAAQTAEGKLYILGAGWSQFLANNPTNMSLAIKLSIPWSLANEPMGVRALLVDADEGVVDFGMGPVVVETELEVGRPPGMRRGTPLDVSFALNFPGVRLAPGAYAWSLEIDGEEKARIPIQALSQNG